MGNWDLVLFRKIRLHVLTDPHHLCLPRRGGGGVTKDDFSADVYV